MKSKIKYICIFLLGVLFVSCTQNTHAEKMANVVGANAEWVIGGETFSGTVSIDKTEASQAGSYYPSEITVTSPSAIDGCRVKFTNDGGSITVGDTSLKLPSGTDTLYLIVLPLCLDGNEKSGESSTPDKIKYRKTVNGTDAIIEAGVDGNGYITDAQIEYKDKNISVKYSNFSVVENTATN